MRKFKCFSCHKFGNYVGKCPNNKKKKFAASTDVEEFTHNIREGVFIVGVSFL
jgi:hypothetical protein